LPKSRSPKKQPAALSNRALKKIYVSSLRLTVDVDSAQIREMIKRGFFNNGIWLDELDLLEAVAKETVNSRDESGRTTREADPLLWARAKDILDVGARVPLKDRLPGARIALPALRPGHQP
jgi:hypothetical protein